MVLSVEDSDSVREDAQAGHGEHGLILLWMGGPPFSCSVCTVPSTGPSVP